MTTTLLILTSILLALAGLAIMHLAARLEAAEQTTVEDQHMIKTMQLHIQDMLQVSAVNEQLTAHNRELNAQIAETKRKAYNREQELLSALDDATRAADNNEWLYNDVCKELAELQDEHKAYVEGTSEFAAKQAREIAELNQVIENLQDDIIRLEAERGGMSRFRIGLDKQILKLKDENKKAHETIHSLMADRIETIACMKDKNDRIEAIARMKEQNEKIARLELDAYYKAEADLTEAIEAAEEASTEPEESPIHIDDKKGWICIGNWSRLIVYKHNVYQPYLQSGLGAKIERTKRSDLTAKAQERYNALKAATRWSSSR